MPQITTIQHNTTIRMLRLEQELKIAQYRYIDTIEEYIECRAYVESLIEYQIYFEQGV